MVRLLIETREPAVTAAPEVVFQALLTAIVSGRHAPGVRLPTERELQADLSTSRASVAKAMAKLVEWRLVSVRQGSGAIVRPRRDWSFQALPAFLELAGLEDRRSLTADLFGLLRSIGADSTRRVTARLTPGDLDHVREAVGAAYAVRHDFDAWLRADNEQFRCTLEATGQWATLWLGNDIFDVYAALATGQFIDFSVPRDYVSVHLAFLDLLEAGDIDGAADVMDGYLVRQEHALRAAARRAATRRASR